LIVSLYQSPLRKYLLKIINETPPLLHENISYSFPITFLSYSFLNGVMNKNAIFLAIGFAAVLAFALAPSLGSDASAVKTQRCTNGGGHEKPCDSPPANVERCTNPNGKVVSCGEGFSG
jgi:hypothetical protein